MISHPEEKNSTSTAVFTANGVSLEKPTLHELNISVEEASFTTIIGPSGSGKSTLLRLFTRFHDYDTGVIEFQGRSLTKWNILELRRIIRLVFQTPTMIPGTVYDNLALVNKLHEKELLQRPHAEQLLLQLGLPPDILDQDAANLSGGQQARIALGRAVADQPDVLLLDEVTASLDTESKLLIEQFVQRLHTDEGITVLWVTHDLAQARRLGQYTWVFAEGRLIEADATETVFEQPQQELTKRFLQAHEEAMS